MNGLFFAEDIVTLTICFLIFWGIIAILILYPYLQEKSITNRINKLRKNED